MPFLFRSLHLLAFLATLAVWTWALLSPNPVPETVRGGLSTDWHFLLSKCLHAGGYAFLAVLGGSLARPGRGRWLLIAFVAAHGALSEVGQATMDLGRHGCLRDVLIDWAGVVAGVAVLKWFSLDRNEFRPVTLPSP